MDGSALPPAFEGYPALYALTVFGLMTVFLLTAEWIHRLIWAMLEQPWNLRHPVTISRLILLTLLISVMMRVIPDVLIVMLWPEVYATTISWLQTIDRLFDAISIIPMALAWLISVVGGSMVDWQLSRLPVPIHLWPTWKQMRRPFRMGAILVGISLVLTFLR